MDDLPPRWLTPVAGKLALALAWELSWGCGGGSRSLSLSAVLGLLGLSHIMVAGFQETESVSCPS